MKRTQAFLLVVVAVLFLWEIGVILLRIPGATISEAIWDWSDQYTMVSFLSGFLLGHLFFPRTKDAPKKQD